MGDGFVSGHLQPSLDTASGPGRLSRAGRAVESLRTYVLQKAQGGFLYATPQPGIQRLLPSSLRSSSVALASRSMRPQAN